jgi:hypothetical protein
MANRDDAAPVGSITATIRYVDGIFGPGTGERHVAFLDRIRNEALREAVHRCHAMEADTAHVSLEENYLLGMCVLAALRSYATAAMFAKVLRHLGTPPPKILEAIGRLSMWVGALPAAEAALVVQKAIAEYESEGFDSLAVWFPAVQGVSRHASTMPPRSSPPATGEHAVSAHGRK